MKMRHGFVSNSSSSSFCVMTDNKETFCVTTDNNGTRIGKKTRYCADDDYINSVTCPICKKRQKANMNPRSDWDVCEQECDCGHRFDAYLELMSSDSAGFEVDMDSIYNIKTGERVVIKE